MQLQHAIQERHDRVQRLGGTDRAREKRARSDFEAVCATSAASFLEFPALRADVGFDVAMGFDGGGCRPVTKVLVDFSRFFRATEENCATALRFAQRKLVKGETLASSLKDATPRRLSESQGTDCHFGHG